MAWVPDRLRPLSDWAERFPIAEEPWTPEYIERHRVLVATAVADDAVRTAAAAGDRLPRGYGPGFDERVVEYPWLFGQGLGGRVLDAGSTFNHPHILDMALPLVDELTITTLAPEPLSFPERTVSYVYADLRALPFRDGWFDLTVSISTLEHVGMDTKVYGVDAGSAPDPDREVALAAAELRRVTRPGGRLLVTVPFGRRTDLGWLRLFDEEDVQRLIAAFGPAESHLAIYAYDRSGWQLSSARRARDASYRDFWADPSPVPDMAAAARAVACITLTV